MYKIEKNVPIPKLHANAVYPWDRMEVGDSFCAPLDKQKSIVQCVAHQKIKNETTFTVRKVIEDGVEVCRVWRIK